MHSGFPNIRHMRVFIETLRHGSVSAAAEICHLSQPAATQAIVRLEADVGAPLLTRQRHRFAATDCGAAFERRAVKALQHLQTGARGAMRASGQPRKQGSSFDLKVTAAQLRTLIAIANTGSFTLAARALELSQPTVHRAARSLETLSTLSLFAARASSVRLTPAAEYLVREVKLAQAELRQGIEEISRLQGTDRGTFMLGSLPLARTMIVPRALHAMISSHAGVQVRVIDGRYRELLRSLREGEIDCLIGALRQPHPADDVVQERLFDDALAIVAHPDHPLAGTPNLRLEQTLAYPWIAPPKETPAGQYLFDTLRIQDREETPVRAVSSSMAVLRGLLAEGEYISVVSRHQVSVDEAHGMIARLDVPLKGHLRQIGLTYRKHWQPTETQGQFIEYLLHFARDLTQSESHP